MRTYEEAEECLQETQPLCREVPLGHGPGQIGLLAAHTQLVVVAHSLLVLTLPKRKDPLGHHPTQKTPMRQSFTKPPQRSQTSGFSTVPLASLLPLGEQDSHRRDGPLFEKVLPVTSAQRRSHWLTVCPENQLFISPFTNLRTPRLTR